MLPVNGHTEMLAEQFLASIHQSHHADYKTTSSTSLCSIRPTLSDTYRDRKKRHTSNKEQLNRKEYENELKSIHRQTLIVHTQLNKDSKQLCTPPPKIAEEEELPRTARIQLAQPRTGYCPLLNVLQ